MKLKPRYISTRSPMRISFIGGGTDYQTYFRKYKGIVISATIDRYVYVNTLPHTHFVEDKYKFTYRVTESVNSADKIQHPVVRNVLPYLNWNEPLNISTMADLPGNTGLGSSSAFVSAFLANMWYRQGKNFVNRELAAEAINIERQILKEPGGWQDQISTVFGGFNSLKFLGNTFEVNSISLNGFDINSINQQLFLLHTGLKRKNLESAFAYQAQIQMEDNRKYLEKLSEVTQDYVQELEQCQTTESAINILKSMINESWKDKKRIVLKSDSDQEFIKLLRNLEMLDISHKIVGSGGGGFLLIMATQNQINELRTLIKETDLLSINLSFTGTEILQDINA